MAALDFMTNPPTALGNSAMSSMESCSSISDAAGNLLFYTDGVSVWNRQHQVMLNGTGLAGNTSSSQSGLIIRQPGSTSLYYIFTTGSATLPPGLAYSIVDMSLAGGLGAVTSKNMILTPSCTEHLAATRHCNGKDVWLISHDYPGNTIRATLITAAGVSPSPVLSAGATAVNSPTAAAACLKVSPTGKKLGWVLPSSSQGTAFELDDFDNSTGIVSNPLPIPGNIQGYSCEFSPDGTKFYAGAWTRLLQWDLCAGSNQAIIASEFSITASSIGALQRSIDGKIYIAQTGQANLGVINTPNALGTACNYTGNGPSTSPGTAVLGLPSIFFEKIQLAPFTHTLNTTVNCSQMDFTASDPPGTTVSACATTGYSLLSMSWNFGDPASGSSNTSTLSMPSHTYPGPGTYTVKLFYNYSCGGGTDSLEQLITIGTVSLTSTAASSICAGQSLTLTAMSGTSYSWSTGSTASSVVVSPTITSSYTVTSTDANGCSMFAKTTVTVHPRPILSISGNNTVCIGSPGTFQAHGANSYTWSTGALSPIMQFTPTSAGTTFTVYGRNLMGCIGEQTVLVVTLPAPSLTILGNHIVCAGSAITLTVQGASNYTWSTGATGSIISFTPSVSRTYSVSSQENNGCIGLATTQVSVQTLPVLSVNQPTICNSSTATLVASATPSSNVSFVWQPTGTAGSVATVTPDPSLVYTVVASINGCSRQATTSIVMGNASSAATSFSYPPVCLLTTEVLPETADGFSSGGSFSSASLLVDKVTGSILNLDSLSPGTYPVEYTYTGTYSGCSGTFKGTTQLTVSANPTVSISNSMNILEGQSVNLMVSTNGSFTWSPSDYLSCTDCTSPVATPLQSTEYCVTASVNSCSTRTCLGIIVGCETSSDLSVPNAFTPNSDGINDQFCLQGWEMCISNFHVMIFSRWGEKLFESSNPNFCWNGSYQGRLLDSGVYMYVITAKYGKKSLEKKGNISLIR